MQQGLLLYARRRIRTPEEGCCTELCLCLALHGFCGFCVPRPNSADVDNFHVHTVGRRYMLDVRQLCAYVHQGLLHYIRQQASHSCTKRRTAVVRTLSFALLSTASAASSVYTAADYRPYDGNSREVMCSQRLCAR